MLRSQSLKWSKAQGTPPQRFSPRSEQLPFHQHYIEPGGAQEGFEKWKQLLRGNNKEAMEKEELNSLGDMVEKYGACEDVVGTGAHGTVWLARRKAAKGENGKECYAIKCFWQLPSEPKERHSSRLKADFSIARELRHVNVVRTHELFQSPGDRFCKAMEFCAGGDLYKLVSSAGKLEPLEAACFFKQLLNGVQYLHEMGVVHRDLKPENLLLTTDGTLKISDFDYSECIRFGWEEETHTVSGICGSEPYIAPEAFTDDEFDGRPLDVWACGVIYMAMCTGKLLWNIAKKDEDSSYAKYLQDRRLEEGFRPIESLPQDGCGNVLYCLLDPNPGRRITVSQILKSRWVRGIQVCNDVGED
ncbi:unnamed protein product [Clonostachys chloroleuca]|uniref:non-specific serine/threonine protein kinase n=2 Tax=Clonostachys chloroleuca TaxID=1926264 RepID=A0AA35Q298_9HYPO|nr:unnamed protein product [Clonostachys chloroleuca]